MSKKPPPKPPGPPPLPGGGGPPPPPPMPALGGGGGGGDRGGLLASIQLGKKLKPSVTNDRSAPVLDGSGGGGGGGGGGGKAAIAAAIRPPMPMMGGGGGSLPAPKVGGGAGGAGPSPIRPALPQAKAPSLTAGLTAGLPPPQLPKAAKPAMPSSPAPLVGGGGGGGGSGGVGGGRPPPPPAKPKAVETPKKPDLSSFRTPADDPEDTYAKALYPYTANGNDQISINTGDNLIILQKTDTWWRAYLNNQAGWVPASYCQECEPPAEAVSPKPESVPMPPPLTAKPALVSQTSNASLDVPKRPPVPALKKPRPGSSTSVTGSSPTSTPASTPSTSRVPSSAALSDLPNTSSSSSSSAPPVTGTKPGPPPASAKPTKAGPPSLPKKPSAQSNLGSSNVDETDADSIQAEISRLEKACKEMEAEIASLNSQKSADLNEATKLQKELSAAEGKSFNQQSGFNVAQEEVETMTKALSQISQLVAKFK